MTRGGMFAIPEDLERGKEIGLEKNLERGEQIHFRSQRRYLLKNMR